MFDAEQLSQSNSFAVEPLNHVYAVPGPNPEIVRQAAMTAAGPHANDVTVQCTWSGNSVAV